MRLTVIEHAGRTVSSGLSALLAAPGGTIGRSPDNHLVLPDKERKISRLQATIRFGADGTMMLRNMSAVLPIGVNGRTLTHEQETCVAEGDRVSIGSYVLEAAGAATTAPAVMAPPTPAAVSHAIALSALDCMLPTSPASDVFSDLFGAGALPLNDAQRAIAMAPVQAAAAASVGAPNAALTTPAPPSTTPPKSSPTKSHTPSSEDWDNILSDAPRWVDSTPTAMDDPMAHEPFAMPSQACRNPVDPLAGLNPDASNDASDLLRKRDVDPMSLFAADDHAPSPLSDPSPSPLTHRELLGDLHPALDLLARPPRALAGYNHSNHARELAGQFSPPVPPASAPAPGGPAKDEAPQHAVTREALQLPSRPPLPSSSSEELLQAFLEGAGVPDLVGRQPLDTAAMQRLGRLMRAFTGGTIELLSSRALLKREVHAEITMIVEEENNPFKILPNGRAVLMQMFGARMPGFLLPEAAVHDALADLQSHQLGMVAGMRAALLTLLQRFDPALLDRTTPHDGSLGEKLLPGGRSARLWRQLQQLHNETTAAVEDDFQAVFGRAFQQAYDLEIERLKETRRA